ncbi:energy transducer TonB [Pseudoxanthomonas putridarboris]|uniref:Energy transducer TonB n=1 Tax=Pseudoxanthomonas putridarboris TaxID=752605 RepID=A0ABU9J1G0_9GAMM
MKRGVGRSILAWALGVWLLLSQPALQASLPPGGGSVDDRGFEAPDEFASPIDMTAPPYPKDMAWQGVGGMVVLIVTIDAEGRVVDQQIEKPSPSAQLNQAALEGSRAWSFTPARKQGKPIASRARVPVDFKIPPEYAVDRVTGRPRDAHFMERRSDVAEPPAVDADGMLPGFVPDAYPIGVASVAAAQSMLERFAFRERDAVPGVISEYILRDEEGLSYWNVAQAPGMPSAVVRRRLVGNDTMSWYVGSILCEGEPSACDALREQIRSGAQDQPRLPRRPALPPLKNP